MIYSALATTKMDLQDSQAVNPGTAPQFTQYMNQAVLANFPLLLSSLTSHLLL